MNIIGEFHILRKSGHITGDPFVTKISADANDVEFEGGWQIAAVDIGFSFYGRNFKGTGNRNLQGRGDRIDYDLDGRLRSVSDSALDRGFIKNIG